MILLALAALLPVFSDPAVVAPSEEASGPRPNRDPDAIPDGKRIAEDRPTLAYNLSVVSDYRLRGISQTDGHAAVQASVEASEPTGFYTGVWGSTIAAYEGSHAEVDAYGGYRTTISGWDVDAGIISYFYPGADGVSSAELYASGAHAAGDAEIKAGVSYTPHQSELGAADGLYLFADGSKPLPRLPITVRAHLGRETGVNTITGSPKIDWLVGAELRTNLGTCSLAWVDARYKGRLAEHNSSGRLVVAIAVDF